VHLGAAQATKTKFYKPTALDAMFFDPWQPPPKAASWGFITSSDGKVSIRESVTEAIRASDCERFEFLADERAMTAAAGESELVGVIEALP
jgi:hypothetical protein